MLIVEVMMRKHKRVLRTTGYPNVSLWVWWNNGWVKIKLKFGQTLEVGYARTTDEGYASCFVRWEYKHNSEGLCTVYETFVEDGRDCDGNLQSGVLRSCLFPYLKRVEMSEEDIFLASTYGNGPEKLDCEPHYPPTPDWEVIERW